MLRDVGCTDFSTKHQSQPHRKTIKLVTVIPQSVAVIWNAEPPNWSFQTNVLSNQIPNSELVALRSSDRSRFCDDWLPVEYRRPNVAKCLLPSG